MATIKARSVDVLKQSIVTNKNAQAALDALDSDSQTAIWNLWAYITALNENLVEQDGEELQDQIDELATKAVPGTGIWLQDQILKFQYSATVPQIIQLVNFYPVYAVVDETLRIVSQCAITQTGRVVNIKVAKGTSPSFVPLDNTELLALQSYVDKIKFAGIQTNTISLISDKLKVSVDIYFDGQYVQANVKTAVKDAINAYLAALPFDGTVDLMKLADAIQAVPGVNDLVFTDVEARPDSIPVTSSLATKLVTASATLARNYPTVAGYIVSETTGGYTLDDTINMILG